MRNLAIGLVTGLALALVLAFGHSAVAGRGANHNWTVVRDGYTCKGTRDGVSCRERTAGDYGVILTTPGEAAVMHRGATALFMCRTGYESPMTACFDARTP